MVIANLFGLTLFLFLIWKNLKDDYQYEKIFNLIFLSLSGLIVTLVLNYFYKSNYWFWFDLLGLMAGFTFGLVKLKMKFYESFEGLSVAAMTWIGLIYLALSVEKLSLPYFILFWISSMSIALYFFFKSYYRTFSWYKSGRVGFAGILSSAVYFLIRAASNNEPILSAPVAIIFFLLLYKLSISKK